MRFSLSGIVIFIFSLCTYSQMREGDKLPAFQLPDQYNVLFDASKHIGKNAMVVFFYPKDDSPGCTKEVCAFRDKYNEYKKLGVVIVGINPASIESHKKFSDKYMLQYPLLSDSDNKVANLFGVDTNLLLGFIISRITYVINAKGYIEKIIKEQPPEQHSEISYKTISVKAEVVK